MALAKSNIIVIVGPTASGKSELAVRLAKKFNGEIISADSRQIYRGLNIGTGKVPGEWLNHSAQNGMIARSLRPYRRRGLGQKVFVYKGVPHYCIDTVSPRRQYSVVEFQHAAERAIFDIKQRGKLPVVVGGTGFWVDALALARKMPPVPPNPKLRKFLEKKTTEELFSALRKLDLRRARIIDPRNPRRLIRAIEIAQTMGRVPATAKESLSYHILWIGLRLPPTALRRRIHQRLLLRISTGMVSEARRLHSRGLPWRRFYELGLEYKFLAAFLQGKISKVELVEKLEAAIWHYAKRQITWFKKNKDINWLLPGNGAERLTRNFLKDF